MAMTADDEDSGSAVNPFYAAFSRKLNGSDARAALQHPDLVEDVKSLRAAFNESHSEHPCARVGVSMILHFPHQATWESSHGFGPALDVGV